MSLFQETAWKLEYLFRGTEKSARNNTLNSPRNNKNPPAAPCKKKKEEGTKCKTQ
jgi:hypothetical protein